MPCYRFHDTERWRQHLLTAAFVGSFLAFSTSQASAYTWEDVHNLVEGKTLIFDDSFQYFGRDGWLYIQYYKESREVFRNRYYFTGNTLCRLPSDADWNCDVSMGRDPNKSYKHIKKQIRNGDIKDGDFYDLKP